MPCASELMQMRTYIHRRRWRTMATVATMTTLSMASNLKPQSQVVRHILIFRARFLLAASVIFDYLWLWHRCTLLFYFIFFAFVVKKKKNRNKIQGAACWFPFSYFILSTRKRALFSFVVLVLRSEGATFAQNIFVFLVALRYISVGRYQSWKTRWNRQCSRINASKIFITGEMMIVRFNWTPIEVQRMASRRRRSANSIQMKRNVFNFSAHKAIVWRQMKEKYPALGVNKINANSIKALLSVLTETGIKKNAKINMRRKKKRESDSARKHITTAFFFFFLVNVNEIEFRKSAFRGMRYCACATSGPLETSSKLSYSLKLIAYSLSNFVTEFERNECNCFESN